MPRNPRMDEDRAYKCRQNLRPQATPNTLPTLPQVVETTHLAKRCADVYFAGDEGLEKLRSLVDEFQLQVCSVRWPSLILTSILQIIATRGIDVHETLVGITL